MRIRFEKSPTRHAAASGTCICTGTEPRSRNTRRGSAAGAGAVWSSRTTARARQLFVSRTPPTLPVWHQLRSPDSRNARSPTALTKHVRKARDVIRKVTYKSRVDGLEIPAYLFAPTTKKSTGHAALVWVHGGVHSNWGISMWPFVREAVERGYVVITPNYRGSTGFGDEFHKKIDYGGKEVDDALSLSILKTLIMSTWPPGMMGGAWWIITRQPFRTRTLRAGYQWCRNEPHFRLSDHSPYTRPILLHRAPSTQGLPFEKIESTSGGHSFTSESQCRRVHVAPNAATCSSAKISSFGLRAALLPDSRNLDP